jgi:prevent-host-death family protein
MDQPARSRLQLVDPDGTKRALKNGAQTITRHGKPIAVVVSAETYARLQPEEKLADILRDCPVKGWTTERDTGSVREIRWTA